MADNAAILQELKALREELGELARERHERGQKVIVYQDTPDVSAGVAQAHDGGGALAEMRQAIGQLIEATEHSLAEHPATTHLTALAVGILLGRLSAR
jgi:hypothetical protein